MSTKNTKKNDKKKFDLTDEAIRPFYASVGAADVALAVVRDYVGDVTKRLSSASDDVTTLVDDLQKNVADITKIDPKDLATMVIDAVNEKFASLSKDAKERQDNIESLVASIGKDYKSYPAQVQALLTDGAATAGKNYEDLAERGESVVNRLVSQASDAATKAEKQTRDGFADVVDDVKGLMSKATGEKKAAKKPAAKPAAKKAPAKKAAAKKAPAKKAAATKATPAKKTAAKSTAAKPAAKKAPAKKAAATKATPAKATPAKTTAAKPAEKTAAAKPAATSTDNGAQSTLI